MRMGRVAAPRRMSQALKGLSTPPTWMARPRSFDQFVLVARDRTTDGVTVAADVLGERLHHEVGAELRRPEADRGGERRVNGHQRAGVVGHVGDRGDVGEADERVGRRFEVDQAWYWAAERWRTFSASEVSTRVTSMPRCGQRSLASSDAAA